MVKTGRGGDMGRGLSPGAGGTFQGPGGESPLLLWEIIRRLGVGPPMTHKSDIADMRFVSIFIDRSPPRGFTPGWVGGLLFGPGRTLGSLGHLFGTQSRPRALF